MRAAIGGEDRDELCKRGGGSNARRGGSKVWGISRWGVLQIRWLKKGKCHGFDRRVRLALYLLEERRWRQLQRWRLQWS